MVFTKLYAAERVDVTRRDRPGVSVELFGSSGESPLGGQVIVPSMLEVASALHPPSHIRQSPATHTIHKMLKPTQLALILVAWLSGPLAAQVFDNTGNGMLNGPYYFREVLFTSTDEVAIYGSINFSGGTYTTTGAQILDCNQNGCSGPSTYSTSGTYTLSASGFGFISEKLISSQIYGGVGANGVFVGSSTESGDWDLFIAAPLSSQAVSTLQGSYSLAYIDATGLLTNGTPYDALLQMTPNGSGNIGTVNVSAYATSSTATTQSLSGIKYIASNGAFVLTFPSNSNTALVQGQEYLYSTPDGSFVFGGSPNNFDMIVGVRTGSGSGLGGFYYQAGMDVDDSQVANGGSPGLDTYYGSFSANAGVLVGHERIQLGSGSAEGYTYTDGYQAGSTTYTDAFFNAQEIMGANGVRISLGIGPSLSISVALPAPNPSQSGSVYINPMGVVNSASSAPFTAGVSRGELITLTGTNIGPSTLQVASIIPLPTTLGGVQVLINNIAAPIYYVSSTQIAALVPYETTASVAQIQVINNKTSSNVVTELVNLTTPGVFTNPAGGIGYAAAEHANGSLVSPSSPAQIGETIQVFVTGLGDVFPTIADGATGVFGSTSNAITADVNGTAATVTYAGLAPGEAALYQVNLVIPSGLTSGDNYLDISGPDSYTTEALISIGTTATETPAQASRSNGLERRKSPKSFHPLRRSTALAPQE